jgi:hypothetical protein
VRRLLAALTVAMCTAGLAGGLGAGGAAAAQSVTSPSSASGASSVAATQTAATAPRVETLASSTTHKSLPKQVVRLSPNVDDSARKQRVQPRVNLSDPITARVNVTYSGFPAAAQTAFQAAVDIWARTIHSSVEIDVLADWSNLSAIYGPDVLGAAGPSDFVANFTDSKKAKPNVFYPIALANAITGKDELPPSACAVDNQGNTSGAEILASFNSDPQKPWYFKTDGNVDVNHVDLESVVLHELAHGFGFVGTFEGINPNTGLYDGNAYYGLTGNGKQPAVFDTFVSDGAGHPLTSSYFHNASAYLLDVLQGRDGGANWNGAKGKAAYTGQRIPLYSPYPWQEGSSFSHLDEAAFPGGNANALMTPQLMAGESEHDVGPVVVGMFQDMGWPAAASVPGPKGLYHPVAQSSLARLKHQVGATGGSAVDIPVVGKFGVPSYVTAVTVNVEIKSPTSSGFWSLLPGCKGARGLPSNGYYTAGSSRTAQVTLPMGPGGHVQLTISAGTAEVNVDLVGWYFTRGNYYHHLQNQQVAATATVKSSKNINLRVAGKAGVPNGASAVALKVRTFGPTANAYLRVATGGVVGAIPTVAYRQGEALTTLLTVPLGTGAHAGQVHLQVTSGQVNVGLDVVGYYSGTASGGRIFHPAGPARYSKALVGADKSVAGLPDSTPVLLVANIVNESSNGTLSSSPLAPGPMHSVQQYRGHTSVSGSLIETTNSTGGVRLRFSSGTGNLYVDALGWFANS